MKKILKYFGITIAVIICVIYLLFLIIPPFINLDSFKPMVQDLVKQNTKLNLDYSKLKIYSTPFLSAGVIVENIEVKLDDNSSLLKTPKARIGIALPSLLTLTVKTSKSLIENPQINLEIINDEQYKIIKIVEDIINEANAKPKTQTTQPKIVEEITKRIRIVIPAIKITNYEVNIVDLKTKNYLALNGEKLYVGYNSARNFAKIQTSAKLYSNENENINANIDIISSLPVVQPKDVDVDPEEKMQIPFVNLVSVYQNYDLKSNIDSKLRIRNSKRFGISTFGYFNIDNLSLKLAQLRLPESFIHAKFNGKKIQYVSNIFTNENEKIALNGFVKLGKRPAMKTQIVSDEIKFVNISNLLKGLLDSLNIKNDLALVDAKGYLLANATIKTNFKKLKSQGSILISDGAFVNRKTNIGIKDVVANLNFDNNVLTIKDTQATINGSKLSANGMIDSKSFADIKINIDNLSLSELYSAFAPKELKQAFILSCAKLSTNIDINGKLDNLNAKLNAKLNNLALSDVKKTMFITDKQVNVDFSANPKEIKGNIKNSNFEFKIPGAKTIVKIDDLSVDLDEKDIIINPFDFVYNDFSKINIKGDIKNYIKNPIIAIFMDGSIKTEGIKQTLGKEISHFLNSKGSIPLKISINGDIKKQEILAQIFSDSNNFITPINLNSLVGAKSLLQADIKMQNSKIKIKNSGLYKVQNDFSDDLENNMVNAVEIADFTSVIDKNHINLLRLTIPDEINGSIVSFPNSKFKTKGKVLLNGYFDKLSYGGNLKIYDIVIPEILFGLNKLNLDFSSHYLNIDADKIDLNTSKINGSLKANLAPTKVFNISNIGVQSEFIDVDKALVVLEKLMKYMPPVQNKTTSASSSADIPVYAEGNFDIKKIKTGAIEIFNTKGDLVVKNNDLLINKLSTKAFKGDVIGNIKMNLLTSLLTIQLKGKNLDFDDLLVKAANMKDTLSGTMKFKTDITLKGATYEEQMKSLKGSVWFESVDGQYGPFAKLENFFLAENVRQNPIFANTIGAILNPITTIDSTHYEKLAGKLDFNNGIANLNPITSQGDILCILIKGNMNLLNNTLDSNVRVRLASTVSDMLGPLSMVNPVNLVKNTPGLNVASAKMFSLFTQTVQESEYKEIPDFSSNHTDANATKFQIVLDGDVAKPLSLVKSFKWLALQEDIDKAQQFSDNYVKQALIEQLQSEYEANNKLKVGVEKILQMDTTAPQVKDVLIEEILKSKEQKQKEVEAQKQELKNKTQEIIDTKKQEAQQKIQEAIDVKKQEKEQKILDAQNAIKSKLQEKLKIQTIE